MKQFIEVNNIRLYGFHGCLEEESRIGGNYRIDVLLKTDFTEGGLNDDLDKTINYVIVNRIVTEEMAIRSKLIEHVGMRIVSRLKSEVPTIDALRVKVTKIAPPINGDVENVAIIIEDGSW